MRRLIPYLLLISTMIAALLWWRAERGRLAALDRVARLEGRPAVPTAEIVQPAETPESPVAATKETRVIRVPTGTDPAPYIKTIEELREHINEQAKAISAARDTAAGVEAVLAGQEAEGKKLRAQLDELRDDLQSARRLGDALQAELRLKSERLAKVESSEKGIQERLARAESSSAKVAGVSKETEDLNRRRDALLTALLRRYREVSDLYRNFTLNAQTREAPGAGLQAGDLSRIQTAIQQAEDDLRQLQALNARMAQLGR